jgi:hypothetical protein
MKTPELKSIDAQPLVNDGLDDIFKKIVDAGELLKKGEHATTRKVPQSWLAIFDHIKQHADKDACVTEEQRQAIADKIISLANISNIDMPNLGRLVVLVNSYRVECSDCVNNTCEKKDNFKK